MYLWEATVKPRDYQVELKLHNIKTPLPLFGSRKIPRRRLKEVAFAIRIKNRKCKIQEVRTLLIFWINVTPKKYILWIQQSIVSSATSQYLCIALAINSYNRHHVAVPVHIKRYYKCKFFNGWRPNKSRMKLREKQTCVYWRTHWMPIS
jgi:hypothetical protein